MVSPKKRKVCRHDLVDSRVLDRTSYLDQRYGLHLEKFPHSCDASCASQGIHVMDMAKLKLEADLRGNSEGHPTVA